MVRVSVKRWNLRLMYSLFYSQPMSHVPWSLRLLAVCVLGTQIKTAEPQLSRLASEKYSQTSLSGYRLSG